MTATTAITTEPDAARALTRLATMLSPAFPVGSFAYSGGLERAVADRHVTDGESLGRWLSDLLGAGPLWNDAVLLAGAWRRGEAGQGDDVNELALALAGSSGRFAETVAQGGAFADAARIWGGTPAAGDIAYPVAVGRTAAANGVALGDVLAVFLNAAVSNLVQAAIRLSVTGQSGGLSTLAALETGIVATATRAAASTLDDLGGAALIAEIAAMNQETLSTRVFRT